MAALSSARNIPLAHPYFDLMLISTPTHSATNPGYPANLSTMERVLLLAVAGSVGLDVLTNVTQYLGVQSSAVALLKGLILILVIGSFRSLHSYIVVCAYFGIFLCRELTASLTEGHIFLVEDTVFFLRILFFITWLLLFFELRHRTHFLRCVGYVFVATITLSVLCQMAGIALNIEFFKAYSDQRGGYKGLFFAENDTSVLYLPALIYSILLWNVGKRSFLIICLAGLILLGLGSKTALLGAVIVPIAYWFYNHEFKAPVNFMNGTFRPLSLFLWVFGTLVTVAIGIGLYLYITDLLVALNYDQLLRVYAESGLLSSLLSYRDLKVIAYFENLKYLPHILFGVQANMITEGFSSDTPGSFMYEIDAFDYVARIGVLGLILTVYLVAKCSGLKHWKCQPPELRTMLLIIFIVGMTVGHTLISSLNGMWMAFWLIAFRMGAMKPAQRESKQQKTDFGLA